MVSTVFFEKKLFLTPLDFNRLKTETVDEILLKKGKDLLEGKCSEHGFVISGSLGILSRSMGYFEAARFTGDAVYYVKMEGRVIYPVDGHQVVGEVIRKNKMGLYVNYKDAIRIQVPRDLHLDNEEYDAIEVGEFIRVELKRSKFSVYDPYVLASGLFIEQADEEDQELEESEEEYESEEEEDEDEEEEEEEEEKKEEEGAALLPDGEISPTQ